MTLYEILTPFSGEWTGSNRLWMMPGTDAEDSAATAEIGFSGQGKFAELRYTWATEGEPEDGLLLLRELHGGVQAVWGDSWHTPDGFYLWNGEILDGVVVVRGSYTAPTGPDWGWRIEIDTRQTDGLHLSMFNITPDGEEMLSVQAVYSRK